MLKAKSEILRLLSIIKFRIILDINPDVRARVELKVLRFLFCGFILLKTGSPPPGLP